MKKSFRLVVALIACIAILGAGCSEGSESGTDVGVDGKGGGGKDGAYRGDKTTTTAKPKATTTAPPVAATTKATTTTAKPVATTQAGPTIKATEVTINGDNSGKQQFEPSQFQVFQGGIIRVTNTDSEQRGIESSAGKFQPTPLIAAGQTYEWKITIAPGTYGCQDSTRPYATCVMRVLPKS